MEKESRMVRMTKKLLKDALMELLEERPLAKIKIKEICDRADVNRTTFYAYYESAETLLRDIENEALEQIPIPDRVPTPSGDDEYIGMMEAFLEYVKYNKRLFTILILKSESSRFSERLIQLLQDKFRSRMFMKEGLIAEYKYLFCLTGFLGVFRHWIEQDFPLPSRDFALFVIRMAISGAQN